MLLASAVTITSKGVSASRAAAPGRWLAPALVSPQDIQYGNAHARRYLKQRQAALCKAGDLYGVSLTVVAHRGPPDAKVSCQAAIIISFWRRRGRGFGPRTSQNRVE